MTTLTREQIEAIRQGNEAPLIQVVQRREIRALCDMALAALSAKSQAGQTGEDAHSAPTSTSDVSRAEVTALLPCPFCGRDVQITDRADFHTSTKHIYFIACFCGSYSACAHQWGETAEQVTEKWNCRALSAASPETTPNAPSSGFADITREAQEKMATWPQERRDAVQLQGKLNYERCVPNAPIHEQLVAISKGWPEELKRDGWIPVSERLPSDDRWVAVKYADGGIGVDMYEDGGWTCYENAQEEYRSIACAEMVNGTSPIVGWYPLPAGAVMSK